MGLLSKWRYYPIVKSMSCEMEHLRNKGRAKVIERNIAKSLGDKKRARRLTNELASEAHIFLQIQSKLSSICSTYRIKDPFAL